MLNTFNVVPSTICRFLVCLPSIQLFLLDWLHCSLFPCTVFCSHSMNSLVIRLQKDLCRIGNSIRFFPDVSKPYGYSYHNILQCKQSNIKLSTALNMDWNIVTSTNQQVKDFKHGSLHKEIKIMHIGVKILVCIFICMHRVIWPGILYTHDTYRDALKEGESISVGSEPELLLQIDLSS